MNCYYIITVILDLKLFLHTHNENIKYKLKNLFKKKHLKK